MSVATQYYVITLGVYFFVYVILELGYNLQFGIAGIINIAFYVMVALGGYMAAVVSMGPHDYTQEYILGAHLPFPLPLLVGGLTGAFLSAILGLIVLRRLRDQYLAIVTLVIAQMAWQFVGNFQPLFNGFLGLANVSRPLDTVLNLPPLQYQYVFLVISAVFAVLAFVFMEFVAQSPFGRVLRAVREDDTVAATFGKDVFKLRMIAFIVGGFMAGVGGGLLGEFLGTIAPSIWTVPEAFVVIAALLIGGRGNNWGAVLGALILPVGIYELTQFIPTMGDTTNLIDAFRWIVIGVLVCLFLWFRPQGLLAERKTRYPAVRPTAVDEADSVGTMRPEEIVG